MPIRNPSVSIACLIHALITSTADAQSLPAPVIRDSAGIRIIEYSTIKTPVPAFRIGATVATVGGLRDDPRDEIETRTGYLSATRLSNGSIAVAEFSTIRVLDATGRFIRTLGGRGGGPGQVSGQITHVYSLPGDSVVFIDNSRRVGVFDARGRHVRTSAFEHYVLGSAGTRGELIGYGLDRSSRSDARSERAPAPQRLALFRLTRDGRPATRIGSFDGSIGTSLQSVVDDAFSAVIHGTSLYADNGSGAEIKRYSLDGKLISIIRWRDPLVPLTRQMINEIAALRTPKNVPPGYVSARADEMAAQPQRPFLPAYRDLYVDKVGRLWVKDYWERAQNGKYAPDYTVFNDDGTLLGRYQIPRGEYNSASVTEAGADYVVVMMRSRETGVSVVVQGISPAR